MPNKQQNKHNPAATVAVGGGAVVGAQYGRTIPAAYGRHVVRRDASGVARSINANQHDVDVKLVPTKPQDILDAFTGKATKPIRQNYKQSVKRDRRIRAVAPTVNDYSAKYTQAQRIKRAASGKQSRFASLTPSGARAKIEGETLSRLIDSSEKKHPQLHRSELLTEDKVPKAGEVKDFGRISSWSTKESAAENSARTLTVARHHPYGKLPKPLRHALGVPDTTGDQHVYYHLPENSAHNVRIQNATNKFGMNEHLAGGKFAVDRVERGFGSHHVYLKPLARAAKVVKRDMSQAQLAHRKRIQAGISVTGSTLGLTALGLRGGAAVVPRVAAKLGKPALKAQNISAKMKEASTGALTVGAGVGGVGGFNFAAIQRAEGKKKPVAKNQQKTKLVPFNASTHPGAAATYLAAKKYGPPAKEKAVEVTDDLRQKIRKAAYLDVDKSIKISPELLTPIKAKHPDLGYYAAGAGLGGLGGLAAGIHLDRKNKKLKKISKAIDPERRRQNRAKGYTAAGALGTAIAGTQAARKVRWKPAHLPAGRVTGGKTLAAALGLGAFTAVNEYHRQHGGQPYQGWYSDKKPTESTKQHRAISTGISGDDERKLITTPTANAPRPKTKAS